jgi:hypothetical protein
VGEQRTWFSDRERAINAYTREAAAGPGPVKLDVFAFRGTLKSNR